MGVIFPQCPVEVVLDNVGMGGELEGEGLLPGELGGEPPREAARVAAMLPELALRALLPGEGLEEEIVHVTMRVGYETRVDAVVGHEEKSMLPARLTYKLGCS